jgi:transcriptional regulator with XRE-family HTH domain
MCYIHITAYERRYRMTPDSLKKWRAKNGYTQLELSKALGVHHVTVRKWEAAMTEIPSFLPLALKGLEKAKKKKK